jgi:hypothetical protein
MDSASAATAARLRSRAANAHATAPYAVHWELQDLFFLAYLGIVVALLLVAGIWLGRVENPWHLLFYHFLIGATGIGAQRLPLLWKHPLARFIRWWYPALLFPFCFEAVGRMIHVLQPQLIDAYLMTADRFLFRRELTPLLQRYASFWLTELMYFCYASFYFFIPGIGMPLYFRRCSDETSRPGEAFREFMLAISLTFWICYLHFLFTPAGGPIFWPDYGNALIELRGGPITTIEQWIFENGKDALEIFEAGENLPNLVLLDINMPEMDGWEFLDEYEAKYASKYPDLKVIMLCRG